MALMRGSLILATTLALLLVAGLVQAAAIEVREFNDPVLEERYRDITASLRCPTCQNQAINDSDAPVAGDMRDRVYQLLMDGRADFEIRSYMVERFGDYVLYNPRLEGRTFLLWGLPAVLGLLGLVLVGLLVRARRNASNRALSAEERARLDALINRERIE
ncbi:cytochrome c-type biogenesis protein CcmH [Halomonas sp. KAO]|uniref:cytochrome c-type biogenesis protein n=1 Tax=unclassified Halomonas TaxID=2609666 RepID=UPI00189D63DB|nr:MULTISPECIES: cytochrome c-type biogenesis protein [unclassified Halomonas]MBF7053911.1 cytochrome c-type biogenesis protein CcmH [Halomonas sp. KAO]MDT0501793.1 cytochrome c-type biogenesis protein [Halomonas sp. PAR7]MDT0511903.1 cytochrome c-type biogenesis protein [Halomonas sp. LES1]MDT0592910.1 cytochrome c-type biogenesis protein [Halomonas sp. PAR8]